MEQVSLVSIGLSIIGEIDTKEVMKCILYPYKIYSLGNQLDFCRTAAENTLLYQNLYISSSTAIAKV